MYDHLSFHLDDFPTALPNDNALNHMGFYFSWAVGQNLHSDLVARLPEFADFQAGKISGKQFIKNQLNSGLDETCFNDLGNRFTQYYYEDEEDGYGYFLSDYFVALGLESENDFYHTEYLSENQAKLNDIFQAAFERWKTSLKAS